eukprot:9561312-Lingulodinium_polyedra.AAC.1
MSLWSRWGSRAAPLYNSATGACRRPPSRVPMAAEVVLPFPVALDVVNLLGEPSTHPRAVFSGVAMGRESKFAKH